MDGFRLDWLWCLECVLRSPTPRVTSSEPLAPRECAFTEDLCAWRVDMPAGRLGPSSKMCLTGVGTLLERYNSSLWIRVADMDVGEVVSGAEARYVKDASKESVKTFLSDVKLEKGPGVGAWIVEGVSRMIHLLSPATYCLGIGDVRSLPLWLC